MEKDSIFRFHICFFATFAFYFLVLDALENLLKMTVLNKRLTKTEMEKVE